MTNTRELIRQQRIRFLLNTVRKSKKENREIDIESLIAHCVVEWGVERRKAQEYINSVLKYVEKNPE